MLSQLLEMMTYSVLAMVAMAWVGSLVIKDENAIHPTLGRVLGVCAFLGALVFGYLLAFEKPVDVECKPTGPAIYNPC